MADVHTKEIRSYNMSRIKSKNTKPELLVRRFLFSKGLRYRINVSKLPGTPDIVLAKYHTVIFIHGCFWHGHKDCKYFIIPKTRTEWWTDKINKNIARDIREQRLLKEKEWKVIIIWECQLKARNREKTLNALLNLLKI